MPLIMDLRHNDRVRIGDVEILVYKRRGMCKLIYVELPDQVRVERLPARKSLDKRRNKD